MFDLGALVALAHREGGGTELVVRLIDGLKAALGAETVALYNGPESDTLELVAGSDGAPGTIRSGDPNEGFQTMVLDGAVLAVQPAGLKLASVGAPWIVALQATLEADRLRRRLKERRFTENFRGVELEALYDVGLAIASTLDLDELAEGVLLRAVFLLDARRGALYLRGDEGFHLDRTLGGEAEELLRFDDSRVDSLVAGDVAPDSSPLPGSRHLLTVPIEEDGDRRGLLIVADKESRTGVGPFEDRDRRTLTLFANQAAIALENARLHRQALE
jgi:hypothetical protein